MIRYQMTFSDNIDKFEPSRRAVVAGVAASFIVAPARAAELPTFKVGLLPFGTVQWEIGTLVAKSFDQNFGIRVEMVPLASSDAARIAFLSGSVDAIANDLLFAARLKAEGKPVLYMPHSTTEGALMTSATSTIKSISDLKGKSIGVAGGPLDKSWLVMRAAALKASNLDLTKEARPVFGAPPLLAAKVESGELDCALLYWSQAARLQAAGYRQVASIEEMLADLGAKGKVAIVGYLFKEDTKREVLAAFGKAVRRTEDVLAATPDAWTPIRPMMKAPDAATFDALKAAYLRGIPRKPRAEEIADAQSFFSIVARLGGSELVGGATSLPESLYVDQSIYG
jgi:NitT/TauT family transport system substrate-binding protein